MVHCGFTPLQHTKVFQIVGHEPEWITYDRGWDVFFKNKSCQPHGEVKPNKNQLKYTAEN